MATNKGVIQGYAAQAAVDSANQVIIAADVVGSGSEQAMLAPMIEQAQAWTDENTLVTADAGYHSDANAQQLHDSNIPALIADGADFSDPGQSFQLDGGQRFKLIADSLGARKCLGLS